MDIEEVGTLKVVGCKLSPKCVSMIVVESLVVARQLLGGVSTSLCSYLAEMDLVKDNLSRVADAPESSDECEGCDDGQRNFVFQIVRGRRFVGLCQLVELVFDSNGSPILLTGAGHVSLAQAFGGHDGPLLNGRPM